MEPLPSNWTDVIPDIIYETAEGLFVSFAKKQIRLAQRYDGQSKHLKAIEHGRVPANGSIGLVPSELPDFDLKSKVLGQGGDYRFHGYFIEDMLHFPGMRTSH
ncbi:hypothetical protein [Roseofilum sp. Guam]|uniref:hypothetical protein n=1 Tax=Roseofilum sp. Guam TaxID=2821502 RepID=UPI001B155E8E|nr:hypothetical protein [Roseofilum sp. Guam]MBP0029371.1 hypothetical protein [Roseofilum sp. Guam]